MTFSSSLSQIQCQGKHAIHFSLYLNLKYNVKVSNFRGVPLASDNKIVVRHSLYTPTLNSATFQPSIANSSVCSSMFERETFGSQSGPVGILPRHIRLLWIGFGVNTAIFRMPLREYMRIHAERTRWQSFAHSLKSLIRLMISKGSRN